MSTIKTANATTMNADLRRERENASFDPERITHMLDGGPARTARRRQLEAVIRLDPTGVFDNDDNHYLHRTERHVRAAAKAVRLIEICRALGVGSGDGKVVLNPDGDLDEDEIILSEDFPTLLNAVADDLPLALHWVMFVPNVRSLCDEEQRRAWLPLCRDFRVVGCYAQTELGHGSNVRALETTATFTKDDGDGHFVIHSPTLTSTKFWPGTLGRSANHAMVIARLIDGEGVDRGIHNFLVPLRSTATHEPLPGVEVGDIGPKIGYNNMDNGFARFDRVIVPRTNMAMRFSTVDANGTYHKKNVSEATSKVAYITMMQVRAFIVDQAGCNLAKACTVTVRYSAVRRQGYDATKEEDAKGQRPELQILDYAQQQHRILPLLAASYCFFFTGRRLLHHLRTIEHALVHGDGSEVTRTEVADLHASSSCLKSFCTTVAADGIEECRKACGGHGFLQCSGLPELLGSYLQNPTVEGDNHMLPQQTVRVLLRLVAAVVENDEEALKEHARCDDAYLIEPLRRLVRGERPRCPASSAADLLSLPTLVSLLNHRAARLLFEVATELRARTEGHEDVHFQTAWNESLVQMARVGRAHALALVLRDVVDGLTAEETRADAVVGAPEVRVLRDCARLFASYWVEKEMGDFLEDGQLDREAAPWVRRNVSELLRKLRPDAVALVDARDYSDFVLKSALGRYDGDVYPAIIASSRRDPLNDDPKGPGYAHLRRLYVDGVGDVRRRQQRRDGGTKGVSATAARL